MRKSICAAALCGTLLLSGCGSPLPFISEKLPDMGAGFSSRAEITFGKTTAQAEIDRIEPGKWEFTFTAPEQLAGVVMTISDGQLTSSLGELSVDSKGGEYVPLPVVIAGGIDSLSGLSSDSFTEKDGVLTAKCEYAGSRCTVTIDKATGEILSFRSPSDKLAVYFSDISPYTEEVGLVE